MAYYIPTVGKSGGTRPLCPPPNCAHDLIGFTLLTSGLLVILGSWSQSNFQKEGRMSVLTLLRTPMPFQS